MTDERTIHEDNDTPTATMAEGDSQAQGGVENTPHLAEGSTGASLENGVRADTKWSAGDETEDPKSGGTPVHAAPDEESPRT